ncbi:hypothetical protein AAY473_022031 [Plecturocebus cupreus]
MTAVQGREAPGTQPSKQQHIAERKTQGIQSRKKSGDGPHPKFGGGNLASPGSRPGAPLSPLHWNQKQHYSTKERTAGKKLKTSPSSPSAFPWYHVSLDIRQDLSSGANAADTLTQ